MSPKHLYTKLSLPGIITCLLIFTGLFGPWLTYGFNSYSTLNPKTRTGQLKYHSIIELNPLFGSFYKDGILLERDWLMSPGLDLASLLLIVSASLSILEYKFKWAHFMLFIVSSLGFMMFFMSIGGGISIGVLTRVGWGLYITGLSLLSLFVISFRDLSRNSISRYMD